MIPDMGAISERPTREKPGGELALSLSGVSKTFPVRGGGRLEVLRGIDLEIRQGEIHALLGRSGCGKSTLLNIIANLIEPDSGRIAIEGVNSRAFRRWEMIGYMFQDDRLLPWRTAIRNVALALENQGLGGAERMRRSKEMLAMVGLSSFEQAYPNELSGGMRSRVALARSLVRHPRILLMDEPFSRLDAQTRSEMHRELVRLRRLLGMTVLFVTHDVEEAAVLANRVTVLAPRPGRVVEEFEFATKDVPRDGTAPAVVAEIRRLKAALGEAANSPVGQNGPATINGEERP
jgi:ABC-type nitrate/sulfonate/bicarbonate transport system ATPase subunit